MKGVKENRERCHSVCSLTSCTQCVLFCGLIPDISSINCPCSVPLFYHSYNYIGYQINISSNLETTCGRVSFSSRPPRDFRVNFHMGGSDADVDATCSVRAIYPEEGERESIIEGDGQGGGGARERRERIVPS